MDCFIRQIVPHSCTAAFVSHTFCGLGFSLPKLTKIVYYYSVLHVNKIFCHDDVPAKAVVVARVTVLQYNQTFCSVEKLVLGVQVYVI